MTQNLTQNLYSIIAKLCTTDCKLSENIKFVKFCLVVDFILNLQVVQQIWHLNLNLKRV